jgi:hypothetical protein
MLPRGYLRKIPHSYKVIISIFNCSNTDRLRKLDSLFHICPKDGTTKKNEMELLATLFFYVIMLSKTVAECRL